MDLEILLRNGKRFQINKGNMFLTIQSSVEGSKIVNLETGKTLNTLQRLPEGIICHSSRPLGLHVSKDKKGPEYRYDISCDGFESKEIQLSPTNKVYAIRLNDCRVVRRIYDGDELFYLKAAEVDMKIDKVLQVFDGKHMTIKEYASNIAYGKRFDCWVTPIPTTSRDFSEWVLVPIRDDSDSGKWVFANSRSPLYKYTKLYEKITTMFGKAVCELGVVVAVGKIGVKHFLVNCPIDFELGSIRLCEIRKADIMGYITVIITKSKPVQLKRKYIETFVTPGGSVLIKAIVGVPRISKWKPRQEKKSVYNSDGPIIMDRPQFNYLQHPILGQIIFSPKMLWSVETLRVLVGGSMLVSDLMQSNKIKTTAEKSTTGILRIRYHILAFHDGQRYIRVPDVPDEMYDSKNFFD